MGYAGLGRYHYPGMLRPPDAVVAPAKATSDDLSRAGARSRRRGARGEREVVAIWRRHDWPAYRQPGSGGWRPGNDARELSPLPGDIGGCPPWVQEVKFDERVARPGRRGFTGAAFIRSVLRDHSALVERHRSIVGTGPVLGVAWFRSAGTPWRCFVPEDVFLEAIGGTRNDDEQRWVEVDVANFFTDIAGPCLT